MRKRCLLLLCAILLGIVMAGCSGTREEGTEFVMAEGQFSEVDIIMQMTGILLEKNTDLNVRIKDSMATVIAANALESGEIDMFMGYDGTLLTTVGGGDPRDVPQGVDLFDYAKQVGEETRGLTLTCKFGFENTYALAIRREFAEENNIETISDLMSYTEDLVFGAEHEFFDEEGSMRFTPFNEHYGANWKNGVSIDLGLKYSAMDNRNIDVTMVYSTDGLILKSDLVILVDDKNFFPQYYGSHMVRDTVYEEFADVAPNLEEVFFMLEGQISNEEMIEMNYKADVEGEDPYDIAMEFLQSKGLVD
ncbi:glycine betaine ABC transporter substrate-binding protein [Alkalibacter saccharofermentans]|uniref:Osmoprotectant transport system substrate-binding protein n=1 Tax=Alkalibacter saccharofermentans DSM 14828 TaxID=1120975 RepID=A0A1M4U193_9FIRM|nr:glycine betaine ABC transporter substrate-binding protein [Alkalibacter saccharofermentans]SHE50443.1 osmoprotectant transport system substrate-binding protein [Alkalibacter saccharofermentans DSM 14828]